MAILIVQFADRIAAGVFHRRVLIGRKPFNGVQLEHRTVSRIHAWIDRDGDDFRIRNASMRSGTTVNGQSITSAVLLQEGDRIGIGPANLVFRLTNQIPDGAVTFDISERGTNPGFLDEGILFHCQCGAPLWVPASMAGAYGKCAHCKGDITVPGAPLSGVRRPLTPMDSIVDEPAIREPLGQTEAPEDPLAAEVFQQPTPRRKSFASPRPLAPQARQICSICQAPILSVDPITACSACSQVYHAECWVSNRGCAAYGCSQVGALDMEHPSPGVATPVMARRKSPQGKLPFPWDFAFLGASVIGSLIGVFTFGVPALAIAIMAIVNALRHGGRARVAVISVFICVVGGALGVMTSRFWWFNTPLSLWNWGNLWSN